MKNKFYKLALYCQKFGFIQGIKMILTASFGKKDKLTEVKVPGIKHPVYFRRRSSDEYIFQHIFIREEYNFEVGSTPASIIDAGANVGFAAVYFANKFPGATIICLEPESGNFKLLQKNIAPYPNIIPIQKGLWNKTAYLQIIDAGLDNWGFTVQECSKETPGAIEALSLTDIMQQYQLSNLDLVKIDIEGSEKEVLEAGDLHQWLSTCDTLAIELHDRMKPGTSKALFQALQPYQAVMNVKGENLIFNFKR